MDDFLVILVGTIVLAFALIGVAHLVSDYRLFDSIKEQCEKQGYVQNQTVRINCVIEKK